MFDDIVAKCLDQNGPIQSDHHAMQRIWFNVNLIAASPVRVSWHCDSSGIIARWEIWTIAQALEKKLIDL